MGREVFPQEVRRGAAPGVAVAVDDGAAVGGGVGVQPLPARTDAVISHSSTSLAIPQYLCCALLQVFSVASDDLGIVLRAVLEGALLGRIVDVNQTEAGRIALLPFFISWYDST